MGAFVTKKFVIFPPDQDDVSSPYDKIFHGAPSDSQYTMTFIYQLFNENHSCSYLDFHPAKDIAALIVMLHTIPFNIFVVCHYFCITGHSDSKFDNLKKFTKIASPIQFIFNAYFYMVFVNSPDGIYGTQEGMFRFIKHYIPYMAWQCSIVLMAIQQTWYIALKDQIPFSFITPGMMWMYLYFLVIIFVTYFTFVWSYILDIHLWSTSNPAGVLALDVLMMAWDVCALVVPLIFSWAESVEGNEFMVVFKEL